MSTIVELSERPKTAESGPPAGGRWPGRWTTGLIGLAVGIGLGIVLAVVTVILPRTRELARWREGSAFFRDFAIQEILDGAAPGRSWSTETQSDWNPWANRSSGRGFLARARVAPGEQAAVFQAILNQAQSMIRKFKNGQVFNSTAPPPPPVDKADSGGMRAEHAALNYTIGEASGTIHLWGIGHGDDYTLIFTLHEH